MPFGIARPSSGKFGAILLAGGASVRMGGNPKALLPVEGTPAVARMVAVCSQAGLSPVVVVAGAHFAAIRTLLRGTEASVLDHSTWANGRTGSIQAGLAAVGGADGVLLWPVDHPFVDAKTVGDLVSRARIDTMALWVIPTFHGRGGHPVVLRRELFAQISELAPDEALRTLVGRLGPQVLRAPVDDPAILENVDTPQAYIEAADRAHREAQERAWTES